MPPSLENVGGRKKGDTISHRWKKRRDRYVKKEAEFNHYCAVPMKLHKARQWQDLIVCQGEKIDFVHGLQSFQKKNFCIIYTRLYRVI